MSDAPENTNGTLEVEPASAKVIDRIRALLSMGNDKSSEHEAAIAMKRARSLMDKYQLDLADVNGVLSGDLGSDDYDMESKREKIWVTMLAIATGELNDCNVTMGQYSMSGGRKHYVFEGFKEDVKICKWMLSYLIDTCLYLYNENKDVLGLHGLADKNAFLYGLVDSLVRRMGRIRREREKAAAKDAKEKAKKEREDNAKRVALGYESNSREVVGNSFNLLKAKLALVHAEFGIPEYDSRDTVKEDEDSLDAYREGSRLAKGVRLGNFIEEGGVLPKEIGFNND